MAEEIKHEDMLVRVLTMLVIVIGALLAYLWQGVRADIGGLTMEVNSLSQRLAVLDTANVSRAESINEQKESLKTLSTQLTRVERGLLRKRIIEP